MNKEPSESDLKIPALPGSGGRFVTEFLANERTFLAWVRTSIAVISIGFVIARFSIWLNELAIQMGASANIRHTGSSFLIGLVMISLGAILAVLAGIRYHVVNQQILRGEVKADRGLVILVTVLVVMLSVGLVIYMLISESNLFSMK